VARTVGIHEECDYEDDYRASAVADAILESGRCGRRVDIAY
jgi:hypothetical protein